MKAEPATESLVENARKGDERAFEQLVRRFYERTFRIALGVVGNQEDAREVAQQAWIKIWKKLDTFKGNAKFSTWVHRITTFTAIDLVRRKRRLAEVEYLEEITCETVQSSDMMTTSSFSRQADADSVDRNELQTIFQETLDTLSEKHRTALTLREIEGLSYKEIAEVMQCSEGTVRSRIFNARKLIRAQMKGLL